MSLTSIEKALTGRSIERIGRAGLLLFLVGMPAFLFASILEGDRGVRLVSLWMIYPGLVVGLGTIAASDLGQLVLLLVRRPQLKRSWPWIFFLLARGLTFAMFVVMFVRFALRARAGA